MLNQKNSNIYKSFADTDGLVKWYLHFSNSHDMMRKLPRRLNFSSCDDFGNS